MSVQIYFSGEPQREEFQMAKGLNLGCGLYRIPGFVNLDINPDFNPDIVHDLEEELPIRDETFDIVVCYHILEHIKNYEQLWREIYRILKPNGLVIVKVPEFPCRVAIADPTHVRFFVPESFLHLADQYLGPTWSMWGHFKIKFLESIRHDRPSIDYNEPGDYFSEIYCELEKISPPISQTEIVQQIFQNTKIETKGENHESTSS